MEKQLLKDLEKARRAERLEKRQVDRKITSATSLPITFKVSNYKSLAEVLKKHFKDKLDQKLVIRWKTSTR
jgi:uncharacterized membrane protein YfbV (UPF0208 family)